jgi:hypothetical protein
MTKMGSKNLLVKIFFGHAIVGFKVMCGSNPVPNPTSCRVLGKILAKFWEFSCHRSFRKVFSLKNESNRKLEQHFLFAFTAWNRSSRGGSFQIGFEIR